MDNAETKKAVIYCRVSTKKQAQDGVSLSVQRDKALAYCVAHDLEVIDIQADEGLSGRRSDNRPGLNAAIDLACEEKAALVAYSLSRFSRSTRDAIKLFERMSKCGADLVSLTESIDTTGAAGKMVFRMMCVLSEFESDVVRERTQGAMDYLKEQGKLRGPVPFGFDVDDDKNLLENPVEQAAIALMLELRNQGHTYQSIASNLELRDIKSKSGRAGWSMKVVRGIILAAQERREGENDD